MAKTVNYTPEMESTIREKLTGEVDQKSAVAELAVMLEKSVASVRQKAVRMGLYKKPEYVGKRGKVESKGDIVNNIADAIGMPAELAESLEKANKSVLLKLREALAKENSE